MSFKNKILTVLLSFTVVLSSCFSSFAFAPATLSAPVIATVSALAVASGVSISNDEDIYKVARVFYEKHKDNQEIINQVFKTGVSIAENKIVTVTKDFLNLVKDSFDSVFNVSGDIYFGSINSLYSLNVPYSELLEHGSYTYNISNLIRLVLEPSPINRQYLNITFECFRNGKWVSVMGTSVDLNYKSSSYDYVGNLRFKNHVNDYTFEIYLDTLEGLSQAFPCTFKELLELANDSSTLHMYQEGIYNPSVLTGDKLDIFVPGNVSDLVGKSPSDVLVNGDYVPSYDLPVGGVITLPNVSNPSIGATNDVFSPPYTDSLPSNPSIPGDTPFAGITDFIVSLVVPSDTFWTDTFNGFRDNFTSNFPMVDMSRFDELVVGGKPFPNIYAYGSKIVDGDVINGIVDWLRPIIAGFIMICLMFFNYRKIYKLIRNSEPFGSIAQGSSDFRTGLAPSDPNPYGNLRDSLWEMRNEILRRERGR